VIAPRLSIVVPFHRNLIHLSRCLAALDDRPDGSEVIVAADGAVDDCRPLATRHGARVLDIAGPSGPAAARNAAAHAAQRDVLVFVDADVAVSRGALARIVERFAAEPATAAVFGAYDDRPADAGFVSQYKNLAHSYIHQSSATAARTFWAGFGAVRRDVFLACGGFDERFRRPSVEDIDFGYRLSAAGHAIVLDPSLTASHLKRWTLASMIVSDVRDRGVPWTRLLLKYGALNDDLNLRYVYRVSVVLAYLAVAAFALSLADSRFAVLGVGLLGSLAILGWRYYAFFGRKRGWWFAARVFPLHVLHHLYNGVSFAIGAVMFVGDRRTLEAPTAR
jgi:GT2 family glycosyltransferase